MTTPKNPRGGYSPSAQPTGDGERLFLLTAHALGGLLSSGDHRKDIDIAADAVELAQETLKSIKDAQRIFGEALTASKHRS